MSNFPIKEIDTTKRQLTVGIGASLLGLHAQSQTNQFAEPLPFAKPAPFTSQEFWKKLLDLANKKKGNPTKAQEKGSGLSLSYLAKISR